MIAPSALETAEPSRPERPHQLAAELLDVDPAREDAHAVRPGEHAVGLDGDPFAQQPGLGDQLGAREIGDPDDEADRGQGDDGEPPAAADRQHPAEQARAAVEHRREHDAGEDQQQRLGEDDHADDEQDEADPDARPLQLLADHGIAELGRAGFLAASAGVPFGHLSAPAAAAGRARRGARCRRGRRAAP